MCVCVCHVGVRDSVRVAAQKIKEKEDSQESRDGNWATEATEAGGGGCGGVCGVERVTAGVCLGRVLLVCLC